MSRNEKLLKKLLSKSGNFTYNELRALLAGFDYEELKSGKTSGSRVAFYNKNRNHIIRLHKPHPGNNLKKYQIEYIVDELLNMEILP
ncbi:MAG TPA: type II toxin-antitoxin system HicA family toxin [Spirochaetota bacterium]|nr:type II toxin-antitoxin system HicA family toxin [Spirochaetota bacterium]HPI91038.1 type II toxin-antitoxin system HicA family toxin [Spirochaetota bacterium]HPR47297.1 type II toxin-antitoxin system HicA family toxin [Spirochaetota bacterium]